MTIRKKAQLTGHNAGVFALAEGATAGHFFSAAGDGFLVDWDVAQPDLGYLVAQVPSSVFALCYVEAQKCLLAGNKDGGLHVVDVASRQNTHNIAHHKKGIFNIYNIENQIITLGGEGRLTRWSAEVWRPMESLGLSNKSLRCLAHNSTTNVWLVGASDGHIYGIDARTWQVLWQQKAHDPSVFAVAYLAGGAYVVSGGRDAQLRLWRPAETGLESLQTVSAHWFTINSIAVHPVQNTIFATASRDKTIKIWTLDLPKEGHTEGGALRLLKVLDTIRDGCHVNSVNRLLWLPDGKTLISASDDRSVGLWQVDNL